MRRLARACLPTLIGNSALASENACVAHLDHDVRKLRSEEHINRCDTFAGKPLLVVNTATHCGFTPQFEGLEVLGVPSDDFRQAARDEATAARIRYVNRDVTFTMLAQQRVRGPNAHPVFQALGRRAGEPSWNFNKYLLVRNGNVVKRFGIGVEPMSTELREAVEALLESLAP